MAGVHLGSALSQIHRLFDEGTLAGLPDARLLERYASERDELAFETLVKRHGRMVMAVCRGVVDDPNDADDAFQAAFLLLARKAGALWVNDSLGGWLHRVACRIALHVRSDAARRREVERRAAERTGWWYHAARALRRHSHRAAPGNRPPARAIPQTDRAVLPGGNDLSAGGQPSTIERGDNPWPAVARREICCGRD